METVMERVPMTTRVDPQVKRRFRKECRRRKVRAAHALERALGLLFAEWDGGDAKTR